MMASSINSRMAVIGETCPRTCLPIQQSIGITNNGETLECHPKLMDALHGQVRQQVKKSQMDNLDHHRLSSREKYL